MIQSKGGFNSGNSIVKPANKSNVSQVKRNKESEQRLKSKKKAASPTKSSPSQAKTEEMNALLMSDEEFEKVNYKFV